MFVPPDDRISDVVSRWRLSGRETAKLVIPLYSPQKTFVNHRPRGGEEVRKEGLRLPQLLLCTQSLVVVVVVVVVVIVVRSGDRPSLSPFPLYCLNTLLSSFSLLVNCRYSVLSPLLVVVVVVLPWT